MTASRITMDRFIDQLRHSVVTAEFNYQIWWVYKEKTSRARFADTMNRYTPSFQTGIHAHFVAYLVAIYRLHENRRNTVNIPRFIHMVEKAGSVEAKVVATARRLLTEAQPLWIKAGVLRNEAFGHRAETQDIAHVFSKASVTPDQLVTLNNLTKKILNGVTSHLNKTAHTFEVAAGEAATRLLNDPRRLARALRLLKNPLSTLVEVECRVHDSGIVVVGDRTRCRASSQSTTARGLWP